MSNSFSEILDAIDAVAKRSPGSVALVSPQGHVNYDGLRIAIANAVSAALSHGVRQGQLIVIAVRDPNVRMILALALMKIGCRVGYTARLPLYDAAAVAVDAVIVNRRVEAGGHRLIVADASWFRGGFRKGDVGASAANTCSLITTSSGSTGTPKLIETSASAMHRHIGRILSEDLTKPGRRLMTLLGDRRALASSEAIGALLQGGMVMRVRNDQAEAIIDAIQTYLPDHISIAPFRLIEILRALGSSPATLKKAKKLRVVGASISPQIRKQTLELLSDEVFSIYGTTETGWVARGSAEELLRVPQSVGRVYDEVELAVFDDQGQPLPAGSRGEVRVKVPDGEGGRYMGKDLDNQSSFTNGWFSTGDMGFVDPGRNLIIQGRKNNVINLGGEKINPEEIEEKMILHPKIVDVGVVGVPSEEGFEQVCAFVVSETMPSKEEIDAFMRDRCVWPIASLRSAAAIPRTENGKIDRVGLKTLAATSLE